jgi:hypothetical protein
VNGHHLRRTIHLLCALDPQRSCGVDRHPATSQLLANRSSGREDGMGAADSIAAASSAAAGGPARVCMADSLSKTMGLIAASV